MDKLEEEKERNPNRDKKNLKTIENITQILSQNVVSFLVCRVTSIMYHCF